MDITQIFTSYFENQKNYRLSTPLLNHKGYNYFFYKESFCLELNDFLSDFYDFCTKNYSQLVIHYNTNYDDETTNLLLIEDIDTCIEKSEQQTILNAIRRVNENDGCVFVTSKKRLFEFSQLLDKQLFSVFDEANRLSVTTVWADVCRNLMDVAWCIYNSFDKKSYYSKKAFTASELEVFIDKAYEEFCALDNLSQSLCGYILDKLVECKKYFQALIRSSDIVDLAGEKVQVIDYFNYKLLKIQEKLEADYYCDL